MPDRSEIEQHLVAAITKVFANKGEKPPHLIPETATDHTLGFDSLEWAEVVVRLETELGFDPFETQDTSARTLETLEDWISLYMDGNTNR